MTANKAHQPVRLLLVTNTLAPGGAEAMLVRLALGLDREVVQPVVLCFKEPGVLAGELAGRSIPVHSWLLRHKFDLRVVGKLCRLIRRYEPVCVMAVGNGGDRMFWSALAARRTGAAMVVWSHVFPTVGHLTFEWLNRRLYGNVDAFVALGQRHREALVGLEGIPADRVHVIHNGIDVQAFAHEQGRGEARSRLGVGDEETVVVGIVANLRPDKRHDVYVEAAAKVRAERKACRFVIIGDGSQREAVRQMAAERDPGGAFISILGERDDVPTLLHGLDIVCLTSEWQECLSVAMLEAMAAGKAFVAPRIGSLDEALIDGRTGRFFEPLTAEALAAVLIELIDQPEKRASLGQQARARVRAEFSTDRMARRFEQLVTGLYHRRRGK